jgi:hypothetical protein
MASMTASKVTIGSGAASCTRTKPRAASAAMAG